MEPKCNQCGQPISQFEHKNCLEYCFECYNDNLRDYYYDLFNPILYSLALDYVRLMREYSILGWENLDQDKTDDELAKILCEDRAEKHAEKA